MAVINLTITEEARNKLHEAIRRALRSELGFWPPVADDPYMHKDDPGEHGDEMPAEPVDTTRYVPAGPLDEKDLYRYNALPAPAREEYKRNVKQYLDQVEKDWGDAKEGGLV